jgi:hypothetical protein
MTISTPCYCSRDDVKRTLDLTETVIGDARIDRAIQSGARDIESGLHRRFFPQDRVRYFDWPNYQYAVPWRIWLNQYDLIVCTSLVTGGITIPLNQVFLEPADKEPWEPFTSIELDRSSNAAFGGNAPTPQHSVVVTGTWGYTAEMDPAGQLAAAVSTATATVITVTDGSLAGAGDVLILDPGVAVAPYPPAAGYAGALGALTGERVIVSDVATTDTGQAQTGSGCSTASSADNALQVTTGADFGAGETLLLDQEQMLVTGITGNILTVQRAWNGTILDTHSGAEIYAYRQLSVLRGQLGTTAATYAQGVAVSRHRPPPLVRDLNIALAEDRVLQETSGYARTVGAGDTAIAAPGDGLALMWQRARGAHGRKARQRAV